jgi:RNA 3'-terminal phosphate cyclase-like protein
MALSEKKVSSVYLGRISPFTVDNLRIIKQFFGVAFKIEPVSEGNNELEEEEENEEEIN